VEATGAWSICARRNREASAVTASQIDQKWTARAYRAAAMRAGMACVPREVFDEARRPGPAGPVPGRTGRCS
jgi:hypothetical protein